MKAVVEFLIRHGYVVLFVWVLVEDSGIPVPAVPILLAAGALSGSGDMRLSLVIATPVLATTIGDTLWYILGRRYGARVLRLVCRISLEPDSCVRQTELAFERRGAWAFLVAKFVPGLSAMMVPLAGVSGMSWQRFALFDELGSLLWSLTYVSIGFVFSSQLERALASLSLLGGGLLGLVLGATGVYVVWKWQKRRRFLQKLRIARITPEELKRRLDAQDDVVIVDLRHALENAELLTIQGAIHMNPEDLENAAQVIPPDREVVLFCSCPNEATAAQMALRLQEKGFSRIRPLAEGFEGWRKRGYPVTKWAEAVLGPVTSLKRAGDAA